MAKAVGKPQVRSDKTSEAAGEQSEQPGRPPVEQFEKCTSDQAEEIAALVELIYGDGGFEKFRDHTLRGVFKVESAMELSFVDAVKVIELLEQKADQLPEARESDSTAEASFNGQSQVSAAPAVAAVGTQLPDDLPTHQEDPIITAAAAARQLGRSRQTVLNWIRDGLLTAIKFPARESGVGIWGVRKSDINRLLGGSAIDKRVK